MQFLKQCADILAAPLEMAFFIAIAALAFRIFGKRRIAVGLFALAGLIAYLGCTVVVGDSLLGPLEQRYSSIREVPSPPDAAWIVVLGSDYSPRDNISVTAALDADGLTRIVEGVRLSRKYPAIRLVVSGGAPAGSAPPAQGYAELARQLGVEPGSLVISDRALNTTSEAGNIVKVLGKAPFLLVSSVPKCGSASDSNSNGAACQRIGTQDLAGLPTYTGRFAQDRASAA
jgi:uncharacterized SAM-binding protein YcdF (DUF218 family)